MKSIFQTIQLVFNIKQSKRYLIVNNPYDIVLMIYILIVLLIPVYFLLVQSLQLLKTKFLLDKFLSKLVALSFNTLTITFNLDFKLISSSYQVRYLKAARIYAILLGNFFNLIKYFRLYVVLFKIKIPNIFVVLHWTKNSFARCITKLIIW